MYSIKALQQTVTMMMTLNCNIQMLVKVSNKTLIIWCTLVRKELKDLLFPLSFFFSHMPKK